MTTAVDPTSPRARAAQAIYAEQGPDEEAEDYERRRNAQTRFATQTRDEPPHFTVQHRAGGGSHTPNPRAEEQWEQYERQMAASRA